VVRILSIIASRTHGEAVTREEALPLIQEVQHICIELAHRERNLPFSELREALIARSNRLTHSLEFSAWGDDTPNERQELKRLLELIGAIEALERCASYAKSVIKRAIDPHPFVPHNGPEVKCLVCGLVRDAPIHRPLARTEGQSADQESEKSANP
jgi:hypothetical protein